MFSGLFSLEISVPCFYSKRHFVALVVYARRVKTVLEITKYTPMCV